MPLEDGKSAPADRSVTDHENATWKLYFFHGAPLEMRAYGKIAVLAIRFLEESFASAREAGEAR
jgi:hypothetical protein